MGSEMCIRDRYSPQTVAEMGILVFAADNGYLRDVEVSRIGDFELALLSFMESEHAETMDQINKTGDYDSAIEEAFRSALDQFVKTQTW